MNLFRRPSLLFVLALLFFAAGTWSLPLIDRDEPRFAEASREMRERGDFIVPYLNNQYRFDKPPLTYWAQVASFTIFGENDFSARFPSVLTAALTVLAIYGFGSRLFNANTGWFAALIFMTCLQVSMHAKGAVADMIMVFFYTITVWAAWEMIAALGKSTSAVSASAQRRWWWAFYAALALGFLAKGPVAWFPLLAIAIYAWMYRPEGLARKFKFTIGMVLVLAAVGAWGIPALLKTNGEFFEIGIGKHVVGRSLQTMEGHGASSWAAMIALLPLYFVTVFLSFFPWAIKLPWLTRRIAQGWKARTLLPEQWFLVINVLVVFGIFTLVRTKLPHYTLPAFPFLALLLARELDLCLERRDSVVRWTGRTLVIASAIFLLVFPFLGPLFPGRELIRKGAGALTPEMEFASTVFQEPSLTWYARAHVKGFYTPGSAKRLAQFMQKPGPRFCVAPKGVITPEPGWLVFEADGFNIVHFKKVKLEMLVKQE